MSLNPVNITTDLHLVTPIATARFIHFPKYSQLNVISTLSSTLPLRQVYTLNTVTNTDHRSITYNTTQSLDGEVSKINKYQNESNDANQPCAWSSVAFNNNVITLNLDLKNIASPGSITQPEHGIFFQDATKLNVYLLTLRPELRPAQTTHMYGIQELLDPTSHTYVSLPLHATIDPTNGVIRIGNEMKGINKYIYRLHLQATYTVHVQSQ